jgi:hypothetical protein
MDYQIRKVNKMVIEISVLLPEKYDPDWSFDLALFSDLHWDNPHSLRKLYRQHLDEAKRRNALIGFNGDVFCAMQGRYDPRSSKSDIRAEHLGSNYLDLLVDTFVEYHKDVAHLMAWFGKGNHETSIHKRQETNLVQRSCDMLRWKHDGRMIPMGYHGFIVIRFLTGGFERGASAKTKVKTRERFVLYQHHGKFGGVVSKGTQSATRHGLWVPNCDWVFTGHTHDRWSLDQPYLHLNPVSLDVKTRVTEHLKGASYKLKYDKDYSWEVEKALGPKPAGGYFIKFYPNPNFENSKKIAAKTEKMFVDYEHFDDSWFEND